VDVFRIKCSFDSVENNGNWLNIFTPALPFRFAFTARLPLCFTFALKICKDEPD
jgi:hypothetical protein